MLEPWEKRSDQETHVISLVQALQPKLSRIQEGICLAFIPPPIMGLGNAAGVEMKVQQTGGGSPQDLASALGSAVYAANQRPEIRQAYTTFRANVPQLYLEVDRTKVKTLGVPLSDVFDALQAYLGSAYVNDFNLFGRTYRVMLQADADFRSQVDQISQLEVRGGDGSMIPMGTLLIVQDTVGPQAVNRYNLYPAATITGSPRPGFSSGQAQQAMEQMAAQSLPQSMGYEWTGTTYQQILAGNQAPVIFTLAFIFVFLFLAAQYESWMIPMAVVLAIPFALIGAMYGTLIRSYDNNIYTQIGLVLLIGLSAKVAILIVEFAKQLREEGKSIIEAAEIAARQRFRPVLMTAFSFILGVVPLLIASGAGSGSRRSLGTAVFFGMLVSTVLGVLFIPVFYVAVQKLRELRSKEPTAEDEAMGEGQPAEPPPIDPPAQPTPPTDTQPLGEVS